MSSKDKKSELFSYFKQGCEAGAQEPVIFGGSGAVFKI